MFEDELPLKKKPQSHEVGSDLSRLSVNELDERVELLQVEIKRILEIKSIKLNSISLADNFFKK